METSNIGCSGVFVLIIDRVNCLTCQQKMRCRGLHCVLAEPAV
jgi:hypothetical protein